MVFLICTISVQSVLYMYMIFFINFIRKVIDNICEQGDHNVYDCHLTSLSQLHTTQQSPQSSSSGEQ